MSKLNGANYRGMIDGKIIPNEVSFELGVDGVNISLYPDVDLQKTTIIGVIDQYKSMAHKWYKVELSSTGFTENMYLKDVRTIFQYDSAVIMKLVFVYKI